MNTRKRIIFIASEKGGVGKSTVSANLLCWALARGHRAVAIDSDDANHTLVRVLSPSADDRPSPTRPDSQPVVVSVNVDAADSLDVVFTQLTNGYNDLVIVDGVGSQHSRTIMRWIEDVNLFEVADSINVDITFVLVVEEDADVYAQSLKTMNRVGEKVSWLVVLNEKQHQKWPMWEQSLARKKAHTLSALEIQMAAIVPHIARGLQDLNVTLAVAESAMPNLLDKQRVKMTWRAVVEQLNVAEPYLTPLPESLGEPAPVMKGKSSK